MSVEQVAGMVARALTIYAVSRHTTMPDIETAREYADLCWKIKQAFDESTDPRMAGVLSVWEAVGSGVEV